MTKHDLHQSLIKREITQDTCVETYNPWKSWKKDSPFFENDEVSAIVQRGLFYVRAGVPINFEGTAGQGKTSIAMQIARRRGRPISILTGNDWINSQDLIGRQVGQSSQTVVDKYVQRVRRSEATLKYDWQNSILAEAMQNGHTLIYDEFTRSSPQANGILLSVLEEGVLVITDRLAATTQIEAHPDFRVILTSNPSDYAGVNVAPDALLDRMITFTLANFTEETDAGIVSARTGVPEHFARRLVKLIRALHKDRDPPAEYSLRAAIMIAQIAALRMRTASLSDALLAQITSDVLAGRGINHGTAVIVKYLERLTGQEAN